MEISFDVINLLITVTVVANSAYGLVVYNTNRFSATNRSFFALTIAVSLWGVGMVLYRGLANIELATIMARLLYAAAAMIPFYFVRFAFAFPDRELPRSRWFRYLTPVPTAIAIFLALFPAALVLDVTPMEIGERIITFSIGSQIIYAVYMVSYFTWVLGLLLAKLLLAHGEDRVQLAYILGATSIPTVIGSITNLLMPFWGIYDYNWIGQISIVVTTTIITYGMFKHRVFDARVIGTQVLMFILWTLSFSNIVFATETRGVVVGAIVFTLTVVFGGLLVRSMVREVEVREQVQRLADNLASANERLREVDRQKSEFLSIASHQLRTPLAAIKGYASLMLENTFGQLDEKIRQPIETIFASSKRMADTVNDFLDVSRIEQGKMEYRMKPGDLAALTKQIVQELMVTIKEKGLDLNYHDDRKGPYTILMDNSKMEHVISNLIDNAAKYTPRGSISVRIDKEGADTVALRVIDTGVGIPPEAISTLFDKFIRARNAKDVNVTGTGLGLYVAREMARAHHGDITAHSEGEDKGSIFTVVLPLIKENMVTQPVPTPPATT